MKVAAPLAKHILAPLEITAAASPLSPTNFQIYRKWPSLVFCFSKSMVYWGYKINKTKNIFLSDIYFMDIGSL